MQKTVRKLTQKPTLEQPNKVAAYARVSSGKDAMLHSLSAQISYYNKLIQEHDGWLYAGVYSDEALTGTKDNRAGFQKLLADCRAGKIDMVITKSISRFARNTVTLLETVRELKSLGVDIFFEEQNIHTMSANGELMMTILASYAQEESLSASENQKWRIKRNFEAGKPWNCTMLGYRQENGQFKIEPSEAEIVRSIFADYLAGMGFVAIAKKLNAQGASTRIGGTWGKTSVSKILRNTAYTGDLLLQKTYRENHLTKRTRVNHGELPMYLSEGCHAAIVDHTTFVTVQKELDRRAEKYSHRGQTPKTYPFTGMLVCADCGKSYRRKTTDTRSAWICTTFNTYGKSACASKQIPEKTLLAVTTELLGLNDFDETAFHDRVAKIIVHSGNRLEFYFKDGTTSNVVWKDRSRSESWTDEMKNEARRKKLCQEQ